ncbi:MAG: hypothetical protein M3O15_00215 [Acidobacteriota bacterium]|nr:hypothetical protein [Acidobacteriota bacterium]
MLRSTTLLMPVALLSAAAAAFAAPQSGPLLIVQGTELRTSGLDPQLGSSTPRVLVFGDGGLIDVEPRSGPQETAAGYTLLGQIPAADFAELRAALVAARIGQQGDCTGNFDVDLVQGQIYLTWFGARGRTHSLLVSFSNGPGSPPCSPPMQRVLYALGRARLLVVSDPASLLLAVPPAPAP